MNHWIIAPVVLPALLAPIIVLTMRHDFVLKRVASVASIVAQLLIAVALLRSAMANPPDVYLLGNWLAPYGIVLVVDQLAALMLVLTATLALAVVLYAIGSGWDRSGLHFHALLQFQLMGLNGAFLTGDAFNLFVFFEVLLIASYGLMIHGGGKKRLRAGIQYVAYNLAGSTLFLFALATLYSVTGTLNMADMAAKVAAMPPADTALLRAGAALLILVFAVKGALVPLQFWLPDTYENAPGPVAALFAVMTKVGAYAMIRMYVLVFPPQVAATGGFFADALLPAALVTLAIGSVGVLGARSLGRLAGFAAIASMGTLFVAVSQFTPAATLAALYYLVHSTLAGAVLFLVADLTLRRRGLAGGRLEPAPAIPAQGLVAALFFAAAIATAGMPPLSGFLGKLLVLDATRDAPAAPWIWSIILIGSLLTMVGLARAGSTLFWKTLPTPEDAPPNQPPFPAPAPALAFTATAGLLAMLVALTVLAGPVTAALAQTADALHHRSNYVTAVQMARPVEGADDGHGEAHGEAGEAEAEHGAGESGEAAAEDGGHN